jgi:hypothetical protein
MVTAEFVSALDGLDEGEVCFCDGEDFEGGAA